MRVNIIIPCYNEEDNLRRIRASFVAELSLVDEVEVRLILVENGSDDNSRALMSGADFRHRAIEIVEVNVNQGYGHGIKQGIRHGDADYYCWTHADLQTPLSDVLAVAKSGCKNGWEVIAGKRVTYGSQKLQSFELGSIPVLLG